jgi:hypothetical protein
MELNQHILPVEAVTQDQKNQMFDVMDRHFIHSDRAAFERDLTEKNWVLLLTDQQTNQIVGFSTQVLFRFKTHLVLFSGDTIVDKDHWGSLALHKAFGQLITTLMKQHPDEPLYWMLISKGLRTYKFLPTFFLEYYPSYNRTTPPDIQQLLHELGRFRFPKTYNSTTGIIEVPDHSQYLDQQFEPVKAIKPWETFYYQRNPGHAKGNELVCLARLSMDNFTPFIKNVLQKML